MSQPRRKKKKHNKPLQKKTVDTPSKRSFSLSKNQWLWLAGVLVLGFITYTPILSATFINYDDDYYITENLVLTQLNGENLKTLFSTFIGNQYAPVAMLIMALEIKLLGLDAGSLKLISILLHLANTFLVFQLVRKLSRRFTYAIIAAGLFAVHPLQVESVAWLAASMKIGTYSLFFLGSLLAYIEYIEKKKYSLLGVALLLMLLSCLSKEQAVVLPVILLGIDYLKKRSLFTRRVILEKVPFFVLAVIFGIATLTVADEMRGTAEALPYSMLERLLFSSYALCAYLFKHLLPINLSAYYLYPPVGTLPVVYYVTPLISLVVLWAWYFTWKKEERLLFFGFLFFLVNIFLTLLSQVLSVRDVMMADRYVYLSSIGFFLVLAYGIDRLSQKVPTRQNVIYGAFLVYGVFLAVLAFQRSKIWNNSISVFSNAIEQGKFNAGKTSPALALPYTNRGVARKAQGDIEGALADYNQAIASNAAYGKAYLNRGNIYFNAGQTEQAIADYNLSLEYEPDNASTYSSRAAAYGKQGRLDLALADLNQALEINPNMVDALSNRALVYHQQQQYEPALSDIDRFLRISPDDASMVNFRGLVLMRLNRLQEAEAALTRSIQLEPGNGTFYLNRASLYRDLGDKARALQDATQAQSLGAQVNQQFLNSLR